MRRVVITGMGVISPCGADLASTWDAVVAGRSAIGAITSFDASEHASKIAGECRDFDPEQFIEKRHLREGARFVHLAIGAAQQAVDDSGFSPNTVEQERVGTFIGAGFCGVEYFEQNHIQLLERGPRRISPYFVPATVSNMATGQVSMRFGYKGASYSHCSACASGSHAIGDAARWIASGQLDAAIAGGTEAAVTPMGVGGFASLRALSKRNDAPKEASRPFDRDRDGFVIAEGAAAVVLEEYEAAKKRGATIYAELRGFGATSDAHHLTQPAQCGEGGQRSMRSALHSAGLDPSDIDYVNAHGTSTPTGDGLELQAIAAVFGEHARSDLAVSSTKGVTGHLLGAAGAAEAVFGVMAIQHGIVPPTINLHHPDEAGEGMNLVPLVAQEKSVRHVLSNSFGFGGTNATLVLSRIE